MLVIGATDLSRKIAVLLLVTSISSPLEAFAEQDRQCIADCTERGYQREFCDSRCSYSVPQNQSQPNSGVGDALNDLARTMGEDPYMRGQEDAARQALIKQQIENQRLQNEVLRRQLGGQGTPRSPQPVANTPEAPSQQPAATPQNGQDKQATKYLNEGNAAYTQKNYSDAFFFLRAAAELGNAGAQMNLAVLYYNGHGVPKDPVKAVEWLRKAAAQGYAPAISNLGWMYQNGWGVRQNYSQARELYQVAAEQGFAQACANLGYLYEKGIGVTQSYDEALSWYRKAANLGHEGANQSISVIEKTLNQQSQTPQTNVAMEMMARSRAIYDGCEIATINNVQPPKGFNFAYEISCSDSSIRKYICDSSFCSAISVVRPGKTTNQN